MFDTITRADEFDTDSILSLNSNYQQIINNQPIITYHRMNKILLNVLQVVLNMQQIKINQ